MNGDISHTEIDPPSTGDALDDPRVAAVVNEYLAELDLGRAPERSAYLNRFPELAGAIAQCLDGLDLVRATAPRPSTSGPRVASNLPAAEPTPRALGDFQILRELGRGGMGVVYEAIQLSLARRVALKVLPFAATFDARQLQRFKNEAQAAALLHHTSIVPIYAVGCERGVHFYAMQLIEGQSLAVLIRQLREQAGLAAIDPNGKSAGSASDVSLTQPYLAGAAPGTPVQGEQMRSTAGASLTITARSPRGGDNFYQKAARLMLQAAEALEHAHQVGIVHRDIKPANLLVNPAGTLWVADFGLALFQSDATLTRTGDVLGTYRYMSPEQAGGQRTMVDHRTDIYSLGATFFELLTLRPLFAGETRHELLYQILNDEPTQPRQINRAIPVELETIVLKALRKVPAERYTSAAEFAEDLRRFLDNRPILARRPTPIDRLRKWSRRHPSVVVAGVLLLTFCLIASLITNRLISDEQKKTSDAFRMISAEQKKTADALLREEQRANEAEELFRQARQAVDVLVKVSEDELADNLFMAQTRKRLLQTALGFYQDFIEQRRGDAASQADLAAVEQRVKGILRELELLHRDMQTMLLRFPVVLTELHLNEQQREQIAASVNRWDKERRDLGAKLDRMDDESRRHQFVALAEERELWLAQALSDEQRHRLGQLLLQSQGLWAFKEPAVVDALALTSEQRSAIRKIERAQFGRGLGPDRGPHDHGPHDRHGSGHDRGKSDGRGRGPDRQSFDDRPGPPDHQQAVAKVLALLSNEQIKRWRDLTGTTLEGLNDMPGGGPHPRGPFGPPEPPGPTPPPAESPADAGEKEMPPTP
ncbi:MAG TPA: protein kinase [Pirellulales bacterium]|nr:protein kinase [Pirellulales bacterium]